jgi:hypothetical protein
VIGCYQLISVCSDCRSCLVKRMRVERTCPRCRSTIRAHGMHKDNALQDLVYKLIPAVYKGLLMADMTWRSPNTVIVVQGH